MPQDMASDTGYDGALSVEEFVEAVGEVTVRQKADRDRSFLSESYLDFSGEQNERLCGPMEARLWFAALDQQRRGVVDLWQWLRFMRGEFEPPAGGLRKGAFAAARAASATKVVSSDELAARREIETSLEILDRHAGTHPSFAVAGLADSHSAGGSPFDSPSTPATHATAEARREKADARGSPRQPARRITPPQEQQTRREGISLGDFGHVSTGHWSSPSAALWGSPFSAASAAADRPLRTAEPSSVEEQAKAEREERMRKAHRIKLVNQSASLGISSEGQRLLETISAEELGATVALFEK